jgi:hypothetical protein
MIKINKIIIRLNYTDTDIIYVDTTLPNPFCFDPECTIGFSFEVPKNKGVAYVYETLLKDCLEEERPKIEVHDYKIRVLEYKL